MKPMNERDPFLTGLIAIAILGLMGVAIVVLSVTNFGTNTYTAQLEHTGGLRVSEDVQVHGVRKGEVTGIELEEDHVLVTFVMDSEMDLGSRTTATVKVATLLGTHYLEVDPQGSGNLADAQIPVERTSVPYNLQDVLESGAGALDELDPELLAEALTEMAATFGATSDDVGPALQGVARLSEVIATRSDQAGTLLRSARSVTDQLSASSDDIVGLMAQTNLVISEVTARRDAIHRLLTETTELSQALTAIVNSTKGKLAPALRDLDLVLDTLNGQDKQLQKVLDVMAPAVRYIANATGNGPYADLFVDPPAAPADDVTCHQRGDC